MILQEDLYESKDSQPMKFLNFSLFCWMVFSIFISYNKTKHLIQTWTCTISRRSFGCKLHPLQTRIFIIKPRGYFYFFPIKRKNHPLMEVLLFDSNTFFNTVSPLFLRVKPISFISLLRFSSSSNQLLHTIKYN